MADLSNNSALAVKLESVIGTWNPPNNTTDLIQVSDLRVAINGITQDINEFTGSIHKPGPQVFGNTLDVTMRLFLRGPGGTNPPAADTWVPGRLLRAAGMAEVIVGTAIPPAPEVLAAGGTTTSITLGATPAGTLDLYKGMLVNITALSAVAKRRFTALRSYLASKVATLAEVPAATLSGSNYQIPRQLAYQLSPSSNIPTLSVSVWHGSRRYDGRGMAVSSFRLNLPTAGRSSQELPSIDITLTGDLQGDGDDTPPVVTPGLAIPPFRDGKLWVADVQMGGTSLSIDFNAQVAYAPDPNQVSGNEAAQLSATTRTASLVLNQRTRAYRDFNSLADLGTSVGILATWGSVSGNMFGVVVTDGRMNYRSPDAGGDFISTNGDVFIDGASKDVSIVIPFF